MLAFFVPSVQRSDLDRVLDSPKLEGAIVSVTVTDNSGNSVYEHNSSLHMVPASNQKLFSNSFALWALGPDYRPKTRFWKLDDRIVIDAPGDPLMSYSQLARAAADLGASHDLPVYVSEAYAPVIPGSWEYDDLPNRFSAPVTALTFDQGGFEAWSKGRKVVLTPDSFGIRVETVEAKGKPTLQYDPFSRIVRVTGTLPAEDIRLDTLALPRPDEAAASIFGGPVRFTKDLPKRLPDLSINGGSTEDMVARCLPPSDNNIAENLLLMGARAEGDLGRNPYGTAGRRLIDFLTRIVGITPEDVHPLDGSGLSRHDFVTTRAIAKLLSWANSQPTSEFWHGALAHPGFGTLVNRLIGVSFQGKTGSLDMDSSLSGYITTRSGKNLIVSIIINEYSCSSAEARGIEDQIINTLSND